MQYHPSIRYDLEKMQYHPRYDELDLLRAELDQEDRIRESLEWSNGEMERSVAELEQYVRELDEGQKGIDDNEWKVRFESQTALNKQLSEQKDWLETELAEARRKLTTGSYPEAMNFNLDALTEAELLRLVKHLERMRNDFYSTLRDTEWKLDKESKEFHHFDEMRRVYKADLKHANASIERLKLGGVLDSSGMVSPLYPPGYFRWLETHTPAPPGGSKSKSPSRKGGHHSKDRRGGGGERSPSRSPTRSKSRGEKKGEGGGGRKAVAQPAAPASDEEPVTTPTKSEVEGDEGVSEEELEPPRRPDPSPSRKGKGGEGRGGGEESSSKEGGPSPSKGKRDGSRERAERASNE